MRKKNNDQYLYEDMSMKRITLLFSLLICAIPALAYNVYIDGIYYNLNEENNTAQVTTIGTGCYSGVVIIPESITYSNIEYSVTSIGFSTFYECLSLYSVQIAKSVTGIGDHAFYGCTLLTKITIPDSLAEIGDDAFYGCTRLETAEFESIESLCNIKFYNYYSNPLNYTHHLFVNGAEVTNLNIPTTVTSIGNYAFSGCSNLTSVSIPNTISNIGNYAFQNCTGLKSVIIPNSVTDFGEGVFCDCTNLASVSVPNSINNISDNAFFGCSSLSSVDIPNSVTKIGNSAFHGCSNLTSVALPNSVTFIGNYAFCGCSNFTSVALPSSITSIGDNTFSGCSNLTSITIPNSVTRLGEWAFRDCKELESICLPNSITSIGEGVFWGCSSLSSISIPNSVTSIGWGAFAECSSLSKAEFESVESMCKIQFDGYFSNPLSCAHHLYINGNEVNNLIIPNTVTSLGNYVLHGGSGLTSITIPESISSIGANAFKDCTNVEELIYAEGCKKVLATNLASVKKVTIPSSVKSIDVDAFINYSSLTEMICDCSRIPTTDGNIFSGSSYADGVLYVPADAIIKYESAYPWYGWGEIKAIEDENALDVVLPDNGQKQYYTIDGNKSATSSNGFYIIKNEDGSVQKVMVK